MTEHENIDLAREAVEAFGRGDWQRLATLAHREIAYDELFTGRRTSGADEFVGLWKLEGGVPDASGRIESVVASGENVVQEVVWEGTQRGPLAGPHGTLPTSGKRVRLPAAVFFRIRGGKITECRNYADMAILMQQLQR